MEGLDEAAPLLQLAHDAESAGFDSVWVGDSLVARPRHEPLTLLAAIAGRTRRVRLGTAVLLPALRNPVMLAHQVATLDRVSEGRVILGVGIGSDLPNVRAEFTAAGVPFDKRVGRMMEGFRLCRALWTGEPVTWDGRWKLDAQRIGPTPHQPGGPPIWNGSRVRPGMERTGRHFDGWFPTGPDAESYREQIATVRECAEAAGRSPGVIEAAIYLTVRIDNDRVAAVRHIDSYLHDYYGAAPEAIKKIQACKGGSEAEVADWLAGFIEAGARHLVLRCAGDHQRQLEAVARIRETIGAGRGTA